MPHLFTSLVSEPDVRWTFAVLAIVSLFLARPLARRTRRPTWLAELSLLAIAALLSATLVPDGGWLRFGRFGVLGVDDLAGCLAPSGWLRAATGWMRSSEGVANVVLFIPAGVLWSILTRRTILTMVGLGLLTLTVEAWQSISGARSCTSQDIAANAIGGAIGALIGAALLVLWTRRPSGG